jgi:hypothetical protein
MGWQQWPRLITSKQAKSIARPGTAATAPYHKNCIWPYVTRIADSGRSGIGVVAKRPARNPEWVQDLDGQPGGVAEGKYRT